MRAALIETKILFVNKENFDPFKELFDHCKKLKHSFSIKSKMS
jgi:hypothetical protein